MCVSESRTNPDRCPGSLPVLTASDGEHVMTSIRQNERPAMRRRTPRRVQSGQRRGCAAGGRHLHQRRRRTVCENDHPARGPTLLRVQNPPREIVCGGPPDTAILRSRPSDVKAICRLSGDQNGNAAPSVPGSARASTELKWSDPQFQFARCVERRERQPATVWRNRHHIECRSFGRCDE